ncbi:MAG TPA: SpoIIE family protein phosphatase [Methylomirabilota bacterium]|jgi:serine phosphatase RsbU (regulator of sigma subunit)|nr:SpoIIE family protein phosphatase [Methylomirabilota bacterium]
MTARPRSVSIFQSLLGSLGVVIVLLGGATIALTFVGSKQTAEDLAGLLLEKTVSQVELNLRQFFEPATRALELLRGWEAAGLLDPDDAAAMNRLLVPILRGDRQLSAVMVADDRGREHIVFHFGQAWRSRQTRRDTWGPRAAWLEWTDERGAPAASTRESDYDPRGRPWYRGAVAARPPAGERIQWTEPYLFYTAGAPGMTAALAFDGRDRRARVVGVDVLLTDISAFTTGLRAGAHGQVTVLTDEGRVIGLPHEMGNRDAGAQLQALLKRPEEIGTPLLAEATRALASHAPARPGPRRLLIGGAPWWVDRRPFALGPGRQLRIEVMVPESDLIGGLTHLRLGIGLVTIAALGLAILYSFRLARRFSRPIAALVAESERISRGDLDGGPSVSSRIREVHRLTDAHGRMRGSLKTLLRLEGDLQVARRIQQDTLPEQIPVVAAFDIDGWNEPADETGGDTYDVIGCRHEPGEDGSRLVSADAQRVVLLLADASGHGIGPALSVTQVRAMLRMAVRVGEDLPGIVHHLNAQLCADLSEGRFVTAWVGELDAGERTLRSFSCGQGPLLFYRAATRACETIETDTMPLGCLDDLAVVPRAPIRMEPGDVFVVLSDGVIDAESAAGERFGTPRVIDVIVSAREGSAEELVAALRQALTTFTGGTRPDDDRTAVVIKCR